MTERALRLVLAHASSSGPAVTMSGFAVDIRSNGNAIYEVGLYAAAVWAYPASLRDRLIDTLVGAGVLYVVNFVGILTLPAFGILRALVVRGHAPVCLVSPLPPRGRHLLDRVG